MKKQCHHRPQKVLKPFKSKVRKLTEIEKRALRSAKICGIMYIALEHAPSWEDPDVVRDLENRGLIEMRWDNPYIRSYGFYRLTSKGEKILESQSD